MLEVSIMIEELLPVHDMFQQVYSEKISQGEKLLKESDIVILSLARNVEGILHKNLNKVITFFNQYAKSINCIIFENDSIDNTKDILNNYHNKYPKNLHVISESNNRVQFASVKSEQRIQALSEYRNKLKDYAQNLESDFVIVLDIDFDDLSLNGLLNSFGWLATQSHVSAIAGNSFEYKKGLVPQYPSEYSMWNYDSWAFRHTWWLDLQNHPSCSINKFDPMLWFGFWIPPTGSYPVSANSAFGGCCIYRSNIYFNGVYDYKDCEHVCFHHSLYINPQNNFHLQLNPSQQMLFIK